MDAIKRFSKLKDEIEQAKIDRAREEGGLKQNLQQLKDKFNVRSVEQARTKLGRIKEQKGEVNVKITKVLESLEAKYEW